MGETIYYRTSAGRVVKRTYATTTELKKLLLAETDTQDAAALQARIDDRVAKLSKWGKYQVRGLQWFKNRFEQLGIAEAVDTVRDIEGGKKEGESERSRKRFFAERLLVEATLQTQLDLKAQFDEQEIADALAAKAEEAAKRTATKSKKKSRRGAS